MKRCFVVLLCIACLFGAILSAGLAEGSASYPQTYIAMLEEFERGNFEDAYTAAKIVYEENPKYRDIGNYYNYLTALQVYLPEGRYQEAYNTFQALALRKFQKAEGYAAYALGCQYEESGDYTTALEYFNTAFANNVDEAYQKIQDCKTKSSEEKYNQAVVLQNQKDYLAAGDIFNSLIYDYPDAREKAKECYYYAAEEYSKQGKYEEAADLFTRLGDYKDSAQKAIQNRAWAAGGGNTKKLGLRLEDSTSTSLTLKWDDETALGSFTVEYLPAGIDTQAVTKPQNGTELVLEGLLPNTQYSVSVSSPVNASYYEINNYWTNQAPPVTLYNIRRVTMIPRLIDRASVRSLGLDATINTAGDSDRCIDLSEGGYQVPERKPGETSYDTYISVAFFADEFTAPRQAEITCVVRLDGKTSVGKTETILLPEKGYKMFSVNLTDLMDVLYENTQIRGFDLTFDVYIDGEHMGSKTLKIGK